MPGRDQTGPGGRGTMTGRGMGRCIGDSARFGRGGGQRFAGQAGGSGFGWGRGHRNRFHSTDENRWQRATGSTHDDAQPINAENEIAELRGQAESYEASLAEIKKRLKELRE